MPDGETLATNGTLTKSLQLCDAVLHVYNPHHDEVKSQLHRASWCAVDLARRSVWRRHLQPEAARARRGRSSGAQALAVKGVRHLACIIHTMHLVLCDNLSLDASEEEHCAKGAGMVCIASVHAAWDHAGRGWQVLNCAPCAAAGSVMRSLLTVMGYGPLVPLCGVCSTACTEECLHFRLRAVRLWISIHFDPKSRKAGQSLMPICSCSHPNPLLHSMQSLGRPSNFARDRLSRELSPVSIFSASENCRLHASRSSRV